MPIFEYQCTDCGRHIEHLQLSSDSPLTECAECGGELRKLLSAPAFQFKGTGWYVTDYAGKDKGPSEGGESKDAESKSSGDGESKASAESKKSADSKSDSGKTSKVKSSSPAD